MFKLYAIGACSYKAVSTTTTELLNKSLFLNSLFVIKRRPIVEKSFILSKPLLLRDIWDNERHDVITSIQLWSKLNVKSNWISEWMLMRKAVPDSLICTLSMITLFQTVIMILN